MAITGTVEVKVNLTDASSDSISTKSDAIALSVKRTVSDGDAANKCSKQYRAVRTLAQNASENLDLYGGLQDAFGNTINFAKVRFLHIVNQSAASSLKVGGNAAGVPFFANVNDIVVLKPGGQLVLDCLPFAAGYAVTQTTGDILQVQHGGEDAAALSYSIAVAGS